ncbi:3-octaprenyl-4-hydroxybenzoate carboxy-lyase : 3-polyprenyl-4-hydroxybenzoate decarboxylase-like protein OS=Singulisphaera acidiphila (strain ATCC BAA-1392 / DSM 18658 / VKM B-2454 / MOB10) GN=Sinac_1695 PE=4 SV=1: UbiD: UbiD [Gemmataceae bacterium]|nr:3-octaprenyl-4-hydroxybenzoate carboxy-lyase : 3-polyprenyl-4-hydroxybenzoate decarboxylase-like protein OS=Singulisphaera acidiphila (strain ATCC BAA-1392 / DSM 18658 / VKM B-2454 / MOB10) GN=Sinac_1695 PE=4 SV=1: UbiD: UbiD [Gemmataceae bacterium]VTU01401.1 3-octaprenyl-4-hydroxybenzoate carboxy-lyase : 3-polyprenyl-4-hydroxybenzoate decarboxylase-like protein OS=Singulisphaera acidiphila (strain ATCC BAA-1392 / DSM 18658 / VKM B-2454 / MOB10) GN=Sinac_1695 PE=4 SV=1: UbiD: UbiD [Gemmataceae 
MNYPNLSACVADLERSGRLVRIAQEIDPVLEAAEVQRRVYRAGGPAVLFERVKGSPFPMVSNLFGTTERTRFLFRGALDGVRKLVELKTDPGNAMRRPWRYWDLPLLAWRLRPKFVRSAPVLAHRTTLSQLPQLKCWPLDGGAFVTLPQVYTEHPDRRGWMKSNLGMYRVQFSGNDFEPDRECGLHYQIHRGIGVHHAAARRRGEALPVNVVVGGPPALAVAAVMPLPEGLPELAFAGALGGRRLRMVRPAGSGQWAVGSQQDGLLPTDHSPLPTFLPVPADADFVISGYIDPTRTKPEGPFGDHLGYYSLAHDFPVMTVTAVYHRPGAIWPFTVVGRPPQEDTSFGEFIHELTGPVIPTVLPGLHAVHAVDAAGVHPLLLAIGSERYVPYAATRRPQELLTLANAILGQGQLSLAKYLFIVAKEDAPDLDIHDIPAFLRHVLERFDPEADLHFQTRTTIDTLDYSAGMGLNAGSKVVVAAAGPKRRDLATEVPVGLKLPAGFADPRLVVPGVLAVTGPKSGPGAERDIARLCDQLGTLNSKLETMPLVTVVDDSDFAARHLNNWLWAVFTRSDPAGDVRGVGEFVDRKHWGCRGPVVIDARLKPHMPPPLEEDAAVSKRVDALFARGGPLHGIGG